MSSGAALHASPSWILMQFGTKVEPCVKMIGMKY